MDGTGNIDTRIWFSLVKKTTSGYIRLYDALDNIFTNMGKYFLNKLELAGIIETDVATFGYWTIWIDNKMVFIDDDIMKAFIEEYKQEHNIKEVHIVYDVSYDKIDD